MYDVGKKYYALFVAILEPLGSVHLAMIYVSFKRKLPLAITSLKIFIVEIPVMWRNLELVS